ncbi:bifunctional (p)ppGpp synthetase/guanosine-3',5'-bis(diphosphate) 3'-pyrophosphohydrolase [Isachenkonia alkalipeptolytica]|uniref:Bifunctional (P)ppGpp synthetase/guanosine-3',5'-bis(Diphosphate) 3'-pyrophosphohydrolase n=1 Tax=Isachenkonia alkalipeptolytica TaxID=2565777 RepID=A0AA43XJR9_9CLOT|nr:bifunctional (p)ppGpp synthetase/guanosine-3',5'-bis(diphosphate) 3'-pyrophosphohydrolase [Isachenkonia alkalipeptolytica]
MHKDQLLVKAIEIAAKTHEYQKRKSTDIPYIVHPFEIAMILQRNGVEDQEILAAGILHDTLEDGNLQVSDLEKWFTSRVKELVLLASEELEGRSERPWDKRKAHTIEAIKSLNTDVKLIVCADKLSNARSMLRSYEKIGDQLWDRFNAGFTDQQWYYDSLVESLKDMESYAMYQEFKETVQRIFHRKGE